MPSVTVRQAAASDNLDVLSVKRAAIRDDGGESYSAEQVAAWSPGIDELDEFESALGSDQYLVLVAEVGDAVAGFGVLDVDGGSLLSLYIQPRHRGTGIGSTLLGQIETTAKFDGTTTLDLLAARNAVGFYEARGYERTGAVEREIDGETLTFVGMEKRLI